MFLRPALALLLLSPLSACQLQGLANPATPKDTGLRDSVPQDSSPGETQDSVQDHSEPQDSVTPDEVPSVPSLTLTFSVERGFYEDPLDLVMEATGASEPTLCWTLDGSDPRDSSSKSCAASPATLRIDPADETGRFTSPVVIVRAMADAPEAPATETLTHTYVFPAQVASLSPDDRAPGDGWPPPYYTDNCYDARQAINYGMDERVSGDPDYASLFVDSLLALPSISLATELTNLFDAETGIYVNPLEHGREWERPASIELLDPTTDPKERQEFQANAGLRIRGGWSRHTDNPKHAFRIFFRDEYGPSELEFPLFGEEGASAFDTFDLRTSQNYSWSYYDSGGEENTMNRDVFSRDTQRDMGQPYTRSRYYHLYLNGVYWGIFQSQERAEASFAATYLGGTKDDWDVVKVDGDDPSHRVLEATDGTLDSWSRIWDLCEEGFESDETYYTLLGLDASGERDPALEVLVDVDNLIDYMLVIFYTGNFDSPTGSFTGNDEPNNFFLLDNREDPDQGFRFFTHDAEHSLLAQAWSPGIGLYEDRVNLGTRTDYNRMTVSSFERFHPQWLHEKLTENAQYRERFNARVHEHLLAEGVLTPERCAERFQARASEIELAIIAESARWGDSQRFREGGRTWRTRDDDWIPAVARVIDEFMLGNGGDPPRSEILLEQLEEAGLYLP